MVVENGEWWGVVWGEGVSFSGEWCGKGHGPGPGMAW